MDGSHTQVPCVLSGCIPPPPPSTHTAADTPGSPHSWTDRVGIGTPGGGGGVDVCTPPPPPRPHTHTHTHTHTSATNRAQRRLVWMF